MKKHKFSEGFTLVELVIVIAVIGIIAAVVVPSFSTVAKRNSINEINAKLDTLNNYLGLETLEPDFCLPTNAAEARVMVDKCISNDISLRTINLYEYNDDGYYYWFDTVTCSVKYLTMEEAQSGSFNASNNIEKHYFASLSRPNVIIEANNSAVLATLPEAFFYTNANPILFLSLDDSPIGTMVSKFYEVNDYIDFSALENDINTYRNHGISVVADFFDSVLKHTLFITNNGNFSFYLDGESQVKNIIFAKDITTITNERYDSKNNLREMSETDYLLQLKCSLNIPASVTHIHSNALRFNCDSAGVNTLVFNGKSAEEVFNIASAGFTNCYFKVEGKLFAFGGILPESGDDTKIFEIKNENVIAKSEVEFSNKVKDFDIELEGGEYYALDSLIAKPEQEIVSAKLVVDNFVGSVGDRLVSSKSCTYTVVDSDDSDAQLVNIDANGVVTFNKPYKSGSVTICVTSDTNPEASKTLTLCVSEVTDFKLVKNDEEIFDGSEVFLNLNINNVENNTFKLSVTDFSFLFEKSNHDTSLTFLSSKPEIASVADDGQITFCDTGSVDITVSVEKYPSVFKTFTLVISDNVNYLDFKLPNANTFVNRVGNGNDFDLKNIVQLTDSAIASQIGWDIDDPRGRYVSYSIVDAYDGSNIKNGNENLSYCVTGDQTIIRFSGEGVAVVTFDVVVEGFGEKRQSKSIVLEVLSAVNVIDEAGLKKSGNKVLLRDIKLSNINNLTVSNCTLYGNGFMVDGGELSARDNMQCVIELSNVIADNVMFCGVKQLNLNGYEDVSTIKLSGACILTNCYADGGNTALPWVIANGGNLQGEICTQLHLYQSNQSAICPQFVVLNTDGYDAATKTYSYHYNYLEWASLTDKNINFTKNSVKFIKYGVDMNFEIVSINGVAINDASSVAIGDVSIVATRTLTLRVENDYLFDASGNKLLPESYLVNINFKSTVEPYMSKDPLIVKSVVHINGYSPYVFVLEGLKIFDYSEGIYQCVYTGSGTTYDSSRLFFNVGDSFVNNYETKKVDNKLVFVTKNKYWCVKDTNNKLTGMVLSITYNYNCVYGTVLTISQKVTLTGKEINNPTLAGDISSL